MFPFLGVMLGIGWLEALQYVSPLPVSYMPTSGAAEDMRHANQSIHKQQLNSISPLVMMYLEKNTGPKRAR
ncbi:hypothetical protein K440DRAFT_618451 [Wilcoxina mikolae CBS 423.85]|nr:hypothetical protein K440DRAFT_618451 [Wilcoxina mikolae CBS 423.85]